MRKNWTLLACFLGLLVVVAQPRAYGQAFWTTAETTTQVASIAAQTGPDADLLPRSPEALTAVIYPFQSATMGSEVRGQLDAIKFKEGERVQHGAVVAEVSRERYEAIVGEFRGNYDAIVRSLSRARQELGVQEEIFRKRATTFDEVLKARSQVEVLESRQDEALNKLKQAEINLKACVLTAPFAGAIAVLYHQPFEMVDNLEKVFEIVDTSKVYARVNWPESRLKELALGKKTVFHYAGETFEGVIEKISSLIDPASKSKRIHVLIDNAAGKLQVGMSGTLTVGPSGPAKVSSLDGFSRNE